MNSDTRAALDDGPPAADVRDEPVPDGTRPARRFPGLDLRTVAPWALALVGLQLALRSWVVSQRGLYADDFAFAAMAYEDPLLSAEFLFEQQGGHFIPAAMLLTGVLARLAPLEWTAVAVVMIVLQLLASLAVLRMLRVLLGDRLVLLVPLAVYLFGTLSLGSFTWWSAAMNSLPLQICLAWFVADAVLLVRTGRTRHVVSGVAALVVGLAFYERSLLIPLLTFALVVVLLHAQSVPRPLHAAWQRGRRLWMWCVVVIGTWGVFLLWAIPAEPVGAVTVEQLLRMTRLLAFRLLPGLIGGPFGWEDATQGTPLASSGSPAHLVALIALGALVAWTVWQRRAAAALWAVATGFVLLNGVLVALGRASASYADMLPLTYRYYAAESVLWAIVIAVLLVLPARQPAGAVDDPGPWRAAVTPLTDYLRRRLVVRSHGGALLALLTILFVVSGVVSTTAHVRAWQAEPTKQFISNARAALAEADPAPLLDHMVPATVLATYGEYGLMSRVFGSLTDRPEFAASTHDLRVLDLSGHLRPAEVVPGVEVARGPSAGCGWAIADAGATDVGLTAPMIEWFWVLELDYTADRDGEAIVSLAGREPVTVPIQAGRNSVYLDVVGGGPTVTITPQTPGLGLCIRSGTIGNAEVIGD